MVEPDANLIEELRRAQQSELWYTHEQVLEMHADAFLLVRYMDHVAALAGSTFLTDADRRRSPVEFTDDEWHRLAG